MISEDVSISVIGLEKYYEDFKAVDGISFEVKSGEIFGLLGPNGAGKTTTLSMLSGLIKPTGGDLFIFGKNYLKNSNELKRLVGIAPQSLTLYSTLTAYDNLAFFGGIYGFRGNKLKERIDEVLKIVSLYDRKKEIVDHFSGGMKRRLNLAIALLHEPKILFLDEPTVGVDPQSRNAIFEAIQKLNKEGMTIIYTTHYMEEAEKLCNQIAIIDNGKIVALNSPEKLCALVGQGCFRVGISEGNISLLVSTLEAEESIKSIKYSNSFLEVEAQNLQESLMIFMDHVSKFKIRLMSLNVFEPNLETVFLKLTGKQLRDL